MRTRSATARRRRAIAAVVVATVVAGIGTAVGVGAIVGGVPDGVAAGIRSIAAPPFGDAPSADDGHIPLEAPISIHDGHLPAIAGLDPDLRAAVEAAVAAAHADGVDMRITGGWRSAAYQQHLLDDAIERYGTREEALRWVSTPESSHHVTGQAVDVGDFDATLWMQANGPRFGLCQVYANELWHYELVADASGACPELLDDGAS